MCWPECSRSRRCWTPEPTSAVRAVALVAPCQRGLEAKGGPRGVADGVNATVVVSSVAIIIVNLVLTQIYTIFFPVQLG